MSCVVYSPPRTGSFQFLESLEFPRVNDPSNNFRIGISNQISI